MDLRVYLYNFFSSQTLQSNSVGRAYKGFICDPFGAYTNTAVVVDIQSSVTQLGGALAHEIAHMLGAIHDEDQTGTHLHCMDVYTSYIYIHIIYLVQPQLSIYIYTL